MLFCILHVCNYACIFAYLVYADIYVVSSSAAEGGQRLHSEGLTYAQLKEDKKMSPNLECYMYTITFRRFRQQKYYHSHLSYSTFHTLLPVTKLLTSSLEAMNNEVIPMS